MTWQQQLKVQMRTLRLLSPLTTSILSLAQFITLMMAEPFGIAAGAISSSALILAIAIWIFLGKISHVFNGPKQN
jgi:hypothetical protein